MNSSLIEGALGCLGEQPLVDVAVPAAQRRVDNLVSDVERIDQVDGVGSDGSQQRRVTRLQL